MSKLLKRYQLTLNLDEPRINPVRFTGVYRGNIKLPEKHQLLSVMPTNAGLCISVIEDSCSKNTQTYEFIAVMQNVSEMPIDYFTFLDSCTLQFGESFIPHDIFYRKLS